jgi:DNA-binding transcriptional MerR regulator
MNDPLRRYQEQEFDLGELVRVAGDLLARVAAPPSDGRVTEIPDSRTVRYYQTSGIVDPPSRYRGRKAIYDYSHLLQILAIKLLQSQGLTLAQIQRALANAAAEDLEAAVRGALEAEAGLTASPPAMAPAPFPRAALGQGDELELAHLDAPRAEPDVDQRRAEPRRGKRLTAVQIRPGVTLLIDPQIVKNPQETIDRIVRGIESDKGEA